MLTGALFSLADIYINMKASIADPIKLKIIQYQFKL